MTEEEVSKLESRFESILIDLNHATDKHGLQVILNDHEFIKGGMIVFNDLREKNGFPVNTASTTP